MDKEEMKARTKRFALGIIQLIEELPRRQTTDVIGRQLLRSGTSVPANYRAACRGRSSADWLSKMGIVEEETDESVFWMEILVEARLVEQQRVAGLIREGNEILAIVVASIRTGRNNTR
jgi:four helix bundle protein